jgi:Mg-chelatase subunit ChlI
MGKDRFGDYLAVVKINGKVDPRIELLKNGLAWTAEKNPADALEQYRLEAQQKRKGTVEAGKSCSSVDVSETTINVKPEKQLKELAASG